MLALSGWAGISPRPADAHGPALAATAVDDIPVGSAALSYVDPEFHSASNRVAFRDRWGEGGSIWVGALNPDTGVFASGSGRDLLVDDRVPQAGLAIDNGPEWIRDGGAVKVLYTRLDGLQRRMYVRDLVGGPRALVGPADAVPRTHIAGTMGSDGRAKILYARWSAAQQTWLLSWLDLSDPGTETLLPEVVHGVSLPTWVESRHVLFSRIVGDAVQLATYDTVTRTATNQTGDADDKFGSYAWSAPELGGRALYLATVRPAGAPDPTSLRLYWREQPADLTLTPFATLTFPIGMPPGAVASPEPFVFQGRSYISLAHVPADISLTSIWVFSVPQTKGGPPPRPPQRVDNPGLRANKIDPEAYVTESRVFVYYYYLDGSGSLPRVRLRRCAVTAR